MISRRNVIKSAAVGVAALSGVSSVCIANESNIRHIYLDYIPGDDLLAIGKGGYSRKLRTSDSPEVMYYPLNRLMNVDDFKTYFDNPKLLHKDDVGTIVYVLHTKKSKYKNVFLSKMDNLDFMLVWWQAKWGSEKITELHMVA